MSRRTCTIAHCPFLRRLHGGREHEDGLCRAHGEWGVPDRATEEAKKQSEAAA